MKIKNKSKVKTKTVDRYAVYFNKRQLELLTALTDFPDWSSQPKELSDFLMELNMQLQQITDGYISAENTGFIPATTV